MNAMIRRQPGVEYQNPPPPKKKYLVEGTNTVCTDMFRKLSGLLRLFHLVPRLTEGHNYCSAVTRWLFKTWV